jgi:WD40 repeat protein
MTAFDYADFDLEITRIAEGKYRAQVVDSPAGQSSIEFPRPFSEMELENFILKIGRTRTGVRRIDSPEMKAAESFGKKLFEVVFQGEVRECLTSCLHQIDREEIPGLRIKLRLVDVPELANLPWEYLYHPALRRFIVLSPETPITRYVNLPQPVSPLKITGPLHLLVMVASPSDYPPLDVDREKTKLKDALNDLERRGAIVIEWLENGTLSTLQQRLRRGPVHLFHFIGHGGWDEQAQDGVLLFENEFGRGYRVNASRLAALLHDRRELRLVVLNACEGARTSPTDLFAGVAATLVQQGIPAVVAMQFEITDGAAIQLAQVFYESLADGYPAEAALSEARKAIFASSNDVEWGTPVLYLRTPNGKLFDLTTVSSSREAEQLATQKAEQERLAAQKAEEERIAKEKADRERLARKKAEEDKQIQDRILDAAIAQRVPVGKPTDLVALVRRTYSDGLRAILEIDTTYEITKDEVLSKPFRIEFPVRSDGILEPAHLTLKVDSPDFEPKSQYRTILVPLDRDSETCTFLLTPEHTGELQLNLEVYAGDLYIASRILKTNGEISDRDFITKSRMLISIPLIVAGYWPFAARSSGESDFAQHSGGINVDADQVSVGQDVTGRDKVVSAGRNIIQAGPGSTVIINERSTGLPAEQPTSNKAKQEKTENERLPTFKAEQEVEEPTTMNTTLEAVRKYHLRRAHQEEWGEAVDVSVFYGRTHEIAELKQWINADRCRLIAVFGKGGMGKTSLTVKVVEQTVGEFDRLFWRDLRAAPPIKNVLEDCILFLSDQQQTNLPEGPDRKITLLIDYLRESRCLIVLDNFEAILQSGSDAGNYREGYDAYGTLIQRVGESRHKSCLMITSREKPTEVGKLEGTSLVRSLRLSGLEQMAGRDLLKGKGLLGADAAWISLIDRYDGNPLALKQVSATIHDLFGNDIATFLKKDMTIFGDIRGLLEQQFHRLSEVETEIMYWLAIEREAVSLDELAKDIVRLVPHRRLVEALESLRRRCMIETNAARYTLQPVIMEYMIDRLIDEIRAEIRTEELALFASHALAEAETKEYVREIQTRLILKPVTDNLIADYGAKGARDKLISILSLLRSKYFDKDGYAGGNIVNLMVQLDGELRNLDFSHLIVRQAYLTGVESHDVSFFACNLASSTFTEPFGSIITVAFSPDGALFAAGTANNEIRLWRSTDNRQQFVYRGHVDWIRSIAFSPKGQLLASGSSDRTVRLWSIGTGHCIKVLQGHTHIIRSVAFNPDGTVLATSGDDQTIRLWDVSSGQCLKIIEAPTSWVWSVIFSSDGQTLISGHEDKTVRIWDIRDGTCRSILSGHTERVRSVALSSDDNTLASAGDDYTVRIWDLNKLACTHVMQLHTDRVEMIAFSPDKCTLASASDDQTIRLWDVSTGQCRSTLRGHTARVRSVAFHPNGGRLASGGDDHLGLWDVHTNQCVRVLQGYVNLTSSTAFSPTNLFLVSGHYDSSVRLWDVNTGRCLNVLRQHSKPVWSVAFDRNGELIASCGDDQTIKLWEPKSGRCLNTLRGHTGPVMSIAFSPIEDILASGSVDHTVCLWDNRTGENIMTLPGHQHRVKAVAFSPDGQMLASGSEDNTVKLWNVRTGKCVNTLEGHSNRVTSVAFGFRSTLLASGSEDNTIRLWDVSSGECLNILEGHTGRVWSVAFGSDDKIIASGGEDKFIRLWNVATGSCLKAWEGHTRRLWSVTLGSDRRYLASSSGTIKLWDMLQIGDTPIVPKPRILEGEKPYARTDITDTTGLTEAQKSSLIELGAVDNWRYR